jgi:hypothetical protein
VPAATVLRTYSAKSRAERLFYAVHHLRVAAVHDDGEQLV